MSAHVTPAVLQRAELAMWIRELNHPKASWNERRVAAIRICEIVGVADAVRAIGPGGVLRPPPAWPEVAMAPVGGLPGFMLVLVRSLIDGAVREVQIAVPMAKPGENAAAIEEARKRGVWELARRWRS